MDYHVTTRRILDADVHQRVESAQVRDVNPPPSAGTTSTYHAKGNRSGIGPAKQARNPTLPSRHSVSLRPRPHCKGNPAKSSRAGLPPEPRRTRPSLPRAAGFGRLSTGRSEEAASRESAVPLGDSPGVGEGRPGSL